MQISYMKLRLKIYLTEKIFLRISSPSRCSLTRIKSTHAVIAARRRSINIIVNGAVKGVGSADRHNRVNRPAEPLNIFNCRICAGYIPF